MAPDLDILHKNISTNIRAERIKHYPGRGGAAQCAREFGVLPQQWTPWETGKRTPGAGYLQKIADFFGVSVTYLQRDPHAPWPPMDSGETPEHEPGTPASFFALTRFLVNHLTTDGLTIRFDEDTLAALAEHITRRLRP